MRKLFFISYLLVSVNTSAQEYINLSDQLGPVRDQSGTNTCFAHAVADAMTMKLGVEVGALSILFKYFENRGGLEHLLMSPLTNGIPKTFQAGLASTVLKVAAGSTLCLREVERTEGTFDDEDFRAMINVHSQLRSTISPTRPTKLIEATIKSISDFFPGLSPYTLEQHLSSFQPLTSTIEDWIDKECTVHPKANQKIEVVGDEFDFQSPDRIIEIIDEALNAGAIPVIHYNPEFLFDLKTPFWEKIVGLHVSTIVGRKVDYFGRKYLLRNTWGPDCHYYASAYRGLCSNGHIWITEDDLRKEVTSATYLK